MVMFTCIYYIQKQFWRPFASLHHMGHVSLHVPVLRPCIMYCPMCCPKDRHVSSCATLADGATDCNVPLQSECGHPWTDRPVVYMLSYL